MEFFIQRFGVKNSEQKDMEAVSKKLNAAENKKYLEAMALNVLGDQL
jgi:hypothetical protein